MALAFMSSRMFARSSMVLLMWLTGMAVAADDLKLQQADAKKLVTLTFASRKFEFPLTLLEQAGQADVTVQVTMGPISRLDGIASSARITSPPLGTSITVRPLGYGVIKIRGELPDPGEYQSWIMFTYEKKSLVYDLKIVRKPAAFVVLGSKDNQLSMAVAGRDFERPLIIRLAEAQPDAKDVKLAVGALVREDGQASSDAKLEFTEQGPQTLQAGEYLTAHLKGQNLLPGKYRTHLVLSSGGQTQLIEVELTRGDLPQNVTLAQPGTTKATLGLCDTKAETQVSVDETLGRAAEVYPPRIEMLQQVSGTSTTIDVTRQPFTLYQRHGSKLVEIAATPADAAGAVFTIPPRGAMSWVIGVGELGPGKYKGRVAISGPEIAKQTKEFEIYVRDAWYYAWVVVVVGVGGSFALHWYTRVRRQQLIRLANVAQLEEAIGRDTTDWPDHGVWRFLQERLAKMRDAVGENTSLTDADFTAKLTDLQDRRANNLLALKHGRNLAQILDTYPTSLRTAKESFRRKAADLMETTLVEALCQEDRKGLDEASGAPKLIRDLADLVRQAKEKLLENAQLLLEECRQFMSRMAAQPHAEDRDRVAEIQANVHEQVESGDLVRLASRLNEAWPVLVEARRNEFSRSAEALKTIRSASKQRDGWTKFDEAMAELDHALLRTTSLDKSSPEAFVELRSASSCLQRASIEQLGAVSRTGRPSDIEEAQWKRLVETSKLGEFVDKAREAHRNNSETETLKAYEEAKKQYLLLQVQVLKARIDQLKTLVQSRPLCVAQAGWDKVLKEEPLKQAIKALATLHEDVSASDADLHESRMNFLRQRVAALATALSSAKSNSGKEVDPAVLEHATNVDEALQAAQTKLVEYDKLKSSGPHTLVALAEADQAGITAQMEYQKFANLDPGKSLELMESVSFALDEIRPSGILADAPHMVAAALHVTPPTSEQVDQLKGPANPSRADLIKQIQNWDVYVSVLTVILASLGGLVVLYFPKETWGEVQDYITAFLWGFGLHEAGNGIVENLTNKGLWPKANA